MIRGLILLVWCLLAYTINAQISAEMGTCRIICDNSPGFPVGQVSVGPPGKAGGPGPKGEKGSMGRIGEKGEPADPCLCPAQNNLQNQIDEMKEYIKRIQAPRDCKEAIPRRDTDLGGVFTIYPSSTEPTGIEVYCDFRTDGGGWIVFQRRVDGSENFSRTWADYVKGFGDINKEFWLGLEKMHWLNNLGPYEFRVDMEDFENNTVYAKYRSFKLGDSDTNFALTTSGYTGDAGNAMLFNNIAFSTKDADHDTHSVAHCSQLYKGGMWYTNCHGANPNGLYLKGEHKSYADGINWKPFKGYYYSLKFIEMKFRRID